MHEPATREHAPGDGGVDVASRRRLLLGGGVAAAATAAGVVALSAPEASAAPLVPVYLPITPVRVYDSRQDAGPIRPGNVWTLTSTPDPNTLAYGYNLTVVNTAISGYLAIYAAGATYGGHSNINWYTSNQIVANNVYTQARASDAGITIRCAGGGGTNFVLDLVAVLTVVDVASLQAADSVAPAPDRRLHRV